MTRPILFSAPMIRALLEGRKTQTRRIMPHQDWLAQAYSPIVSGNAIFNYAGEEEVSRARFAVGDRLWVRETFQVYGCYETELGFELGYPIKGPLPKEELRSNAVVFRADDQIGPWRSPIHMPRWASRLTLIVTGVKVERLQDISATDAEAEGVVWESADPPFYYVPGIFPHSRTAVGIEEPGSSPHAVRSYAKLWGEINGPGSWNENPWVAAISFCVIKANIDKIEASP